MSTIFGTRLKSCLLALTCVLALAMTPSLADAGPGLGKSLGSRGSRSFLAPPATSTAPYGASPFQRSLAQPAAPYGSGYGSSYGARPYRSGFGGAFGRGFLGGLIGAGIGGMLFGGGFFGFHGLFGFVGLLIQLYLLYLLITWLLRSAGMAPAFAGMGAGMGNFARTMFPQGPARQAYGGGPAAPPPRPGRQIAIVQDDYQQFNRLLQGIQAAWTNHDLNGLRAMATPEMVSYFGEQLAEQVSRGVRNEVRDVRLLKGDLSEAWSEGSREYATVSLRVSMIDVTRDSTGRVVDGSPTEHITITEFWTFLRAPGSHWVLTAIQQAN